MTVMAYFLNLLAFRFGADPSYKPVKQYKPIIDSQVLVL